MEKITKESLQEKGRLSSACMLQQSMFTVVGVGIGLAFGLRSKNVKPFLLGAFGGTLGDYGYGILYACKSVIEDYQKCKVEYDRIVEAKVEAAASSKAHTVNIKKK